MAVGKIISNRCVTLVREAMVASSYDIGHSRRASAFYVSLPCPSVP